MDASKREAISARALTLIRSHFEFLNEGKLEAARKQLFFPRGMADEPLIVYAKTMSQLTPFRILSISVSRFEDVRQKKHGAVATVWVNVGVSCSLGERSADLAVWWFPESDECQISARPSHWVLEKLSGNGTTP
jgi:hypothetical protein